MQGSDIYKPYFYLSYSDSYIPVTNIRLSDSSLTLDVGKTHTFYPIVTPGDATNQEFTWTSSNTAVATVSSSGKVTAKKAGTAVITAKSKDNPSITPAKCTVTVEIPDSDGDGLDDEIEKQLGTNPHNRDTDGDGVYDEEEYYLSTNPLKADSDQDGLSDCLEIELWYDPLDPNPDNDSFNDYEEYENETDPYVYDMTADESAAAFWEGALLGDFVVPDNIETLLGQISFSFVPVVADVRDYFANVFVNGDTLTAIFNLGGALLDVVPGAGVAGDVAKALPKLGRFVVKFADDAAMAMEAIVRGAKLFPNADEVLPGLVKILPVGTLDNIAKSIKNGDNITKANYKKLQQVFEASGKNLDDVVGNGGIILKGTNYSKDFAKKLQDTHKLFASNGFDISEHALCRLLGRINQGKIKSVDEVVDVLKTGTKYADTVNGGIVIFKNKVSIHLAENGIIKTIIGDAHIKSTWEVIN